MSQTLFPNISLKKIRAKGDGYSQSFNGGASGSGRDIGAMIKSVVQRMRLKVDANHSIEYVMSVTAFSKSAAKAKGRGFVRAKNPFEPDIISTSATEKASSVGIGGVRSMYEVRVEIQK